MIVVACNTATASAIEVLRKDYDVPFIGLEPAIKPAAKSTKTGHIGILATKGTFQGKLYRATSKKIAQKAKLHLQIGSGLVEIVEKGQIHKKKTKTLLESYLMPMLDSGVDQIVLGCTHYPFLIPIIKQIVGEKVNIINPAPAVGQRTKQQLEEYQLANPNKKSSPITFYASGDIKTLTKMAKELFGNWFIVR